VSMLRFFPSPVCLGGATVLEFMRNAARSGSTARPEGPTDVRRRPTGHAHQGVGAHVNTHRRYGSRHIGAAHLEVDLQASERPTSCAVMVRPGQPGRWSRPSSSSQGSR
jgi:hypothetical protein